MRPWSAASHDGVKWGGRCSAVIMLERAGVSLVGEHVKHIAVGRVATAEISAVGFQREDIDINILSPSKVPVLYR